MSPAFPDPHHSHVRVGKIGKAVLCRRLLGKTENKGSSILERYVYARSSLSAKQKTQSDAIGLWSTTVGIGHEQVQARQFIREPRNR